MLHLLINTIQGTIMECPLLHIIDNYVLMLSMYAYIINNFSFAVEVHISLAKPPLIFYSSFYLDTINNWCSVVPRPDTTESHK